MAVHYGRTSFVRAEQNEFLTRTGQGTPMGDLFRRYWLPALAAGVISLKA